MAGLSLLLGRAEGSPPWRSAVALVSGVLVPAYLLLDVSWDAASFGSADLDLAGDAGKLTLDREGSSWEPVDVGSLLAKLEVYAGTGRGSTNR